MKFCYHGSNFRQKFQAVLGYAFRESDTRLSPPLFKDEGLRGIGYSASIGNLILAVKSVTISYLRIIMRIMRIYYKMRQILLQIAVAILLQNSTEVYLKMRQLFYYKMREFYYKMHQIL